MSHSPINGRQRMSNDIVVPPTRAIKKIVVFFTPHS